MERKFQDKGLDHDCREKPWTSPGSNLWHQITLPIGCTALYRLSQIPIYKNRWLSGEFLGAGFPIDTEEVDMDIRRKHRSDCEHVYLIRTSRVLSPDRTWPDRLLSEMHPPWSPVLIGNPAPKNSPLDHLLLQRGIWLSR